MTEWSSVIYNCFQSWDTTLDEHAGASWHFISPPPHFIWKNTSCRGRKGREETESDSNHTQAKSTWYEGTQPQLQSSSTDVFFGFLRLLIWWVFHRGPQFLVVHELVCAVLGHSYFWCSWLVRHAKESLGFIPTTVSQITQILKAFCLFCDCTNIKANSPPLTIMALFLIFYVTSDKGFCLQ